MEVLKAKDKKTAQRLQEKLLRKRKTVGLINKEEELQKLKDKKVDVVILFPQE